MSRINKPAYPIRGRILLCGCNTPSWLLSSARQKLRCFSGLAAPPATLNKRVSHSSTWGRQCKYLCTCTKKYGVTSRWAQSALPKCAIAKSRAARANHWHGRLDFERSRQGRGQGSAKDQLGGRLSTGGGCHKPC